MERSNIRLAQTIASAGVACPVVQGTCHNGPCRDGCIFQRQQTRADIETAISALRTARQFLRGAGAKRAAAYVARAIKSAEGARRHADSRLTRAQHAGR